MISPLKTWQHSEPKGLWPALGGLAITAHVGVLGLSLPYVMQLMQPAGSPAAVVPIELIDVDSAELVNSTPVESLADEASTVPTDSVLTDRSLPQNDDTAPVATSSSESIASQPKVSELETSEFKTPELETSEPETPELETAPERTNPIEPPPADETDSDPNPTEPSPASTETAPSPATENLPESPQTEEPLAALPGEQSLPLPEDSTGENAAAKTAYISVVDHSYVPTELLVDVADTPPALDYSAVTSLSATPQDLGCGEVDFSQGQVTYRAVVSPEGTLRSAAPWTGSIEPQSLSASEGAIACLLTAAGFSFTPAFTDGAAVANDSLLLTIDIVESQ